MPVSFDPRTTSVPYYLIDLLKKDHDGTEAKDRSVIGDSSKASGLEVRMLPPQIKDNGKNPLIGKDLAKLYCLTIVVSDQDNQTVGGIDLKGFPRIGDNEPLPINKTIFYWQADDNNQSAPNQIHFISRVIRSRQGLRDVGQVLTEAKQDPEYKGLVQSIGNMLKSASAFLEISQSIFALSSIIGRYLGNVEDKDLGTVINSYTTLHGDFDKKGINEYNYPTTNVDFRFELIVRDASEQKSLRSAERSMVPIEEESEEVEVDLTPM